MLQKNKMHHRRFDGTGFMRRYAAIMARYEAEKSEATKRQFVTVKGRIMTALPRSAALPIALHLEG